MGDRLQGVGIGGGNCRGMAVLAIKYTGDRKPSFFASESEAQFFWKEGKRNKYHYSFDRSIRIRRFISVHTVSRKVLCKAACYQGAECMVLQVPGLRGLLVRALCGAAEGKGCSTLRRLYTVYSVQVYI